MVLNEFVEELDVAIKQDGHDIYCDTETAEMLRLLIDEYMAFQKLLEYIKDGKEYYADGSLCSLSESIIGERVCDDILKYYTGLKKTMNE